MKILAIGAGVTGCFTAALLARKGVEASILARGTRADRLERDGLHLRDGVTGERETVELDVVREAPKAEVDLAMVFVQASQRSSLDELLESLPGRPVVWYLGNTTRGFDDPERRFGADRVLGGFPGVGGFWEGDELVFGDREKPGDRPFDRLTLGEAHPDGTAAAQRVQAELQRAGLDVERHVPIMAWHWCHVAMVLPLAGAICRHDGNLDALVGDSALMRQAIRATAQALTAVRRAGHPILPRGLGVMRWLPAWLGARRVASLMQSDFGRVALAAHATAARDEMRDLAGDLLALAGADAGSDLRAVPGFL